MGLLLGALFLPVVCRSRAKFSMPPPSHAESPLPWIIAHIIHSIAAAFLTNDMPHFVNGVSGRPFRTPFVRPQEAKLSSPATNAAWGCFNFLVVLLFANIAPLYIETVGDTIFVAAGFLIAGVLLARIFERIVPE